MNQSNAFSTLQKLDPVCIVMLKKHTDVDKNLNAFLAKQKEPAKVLQLLLEELHYHESVFLLSFGLPHQERVWWSYLAALKAEGEEPSQHVLTALSAIRHWVHQPKSEFAAQAKIATDTVDPASAVRWAALGTFWSNENIGYKSKLPVKPNPMMAKLAAANAIIKTGEQGQERDLDFLTLIFQGIHIAAGGNGQLGEKEQALIARYLKRT